MEKKTNIIYGGTKLLHISQKILFLMGFSYENISLVFIDYIFSTLGAFNEYQIQKID